MKSLLALAAGALMALALPASATLRLNEIHSNPAGADIVGTNNYEYIEIISSTPQESCNTWQVILIDNDGGSIGRVDAIWSLDGMTTGTNGILLLGVNYGVAPKGGPWAAQVPAATECRSIAIPAGKDGLIEPNRAYAILLAQNYTGVVGSDLSTLDVNINTTFKNNNLRDSVGLNEYKFNTSDQVPPGPVANLSQSNYSPGNVSRLVGNSTVNSASAWFGGTVIGNTGTSVSFDPVQRFGTQVNPVATPGAPNTPPTMADVRINEVHVDPGGPDNNNEYIELLKVGGDASTGEGYHLLVINTDANSDTSCGTDRSQGVIVEAWDLSQVQFGSNGLAMIGQDYDKGLSPWRDHVAAGTILSDIGSSTDAAAIKLGSDDIGNEIWTKVANVCQLDRTNSGFTLLLVKGFTGTPLQDLDLNNDGILDATPWTEITDSVGYNGSGNTYAPANVSQAGYLPDNISRKAGNTTANSAAAFYGGSMGGNSPYDLDFSSEFFGGFRGQATPGRLNLSAAVTTPAPLRINEVNFDPPADAAEFIELASNGTDAIIPTQGYHLLIVSTAAADRGTLLQAYDLSGYSTGPNGLLLLGDNFPATIGTLFPPHTVRADTAVESGPPGFTAGQLPDQDFAVLLVTGFSGAPGMDLDANNDGSIDAGLGFTIVDGVSLGTLIHPAVTNLAAGTELDNISRIPGSSNWYGGTISSGLAFNAQGAYGPWTGSVTPGQGNHAAAPAATPVLINEANVNPPGDDLNYDFVELLATGLKAQSTNDLTLLVIDTSAGDTGTGNIGEINRVWNLDSLATGENGLLLLGNGYTQAPAGGPFAALKAALTATGDPRGMDSDALASNDGIALVLVKGFSGKLGQDLDLENDGILDGSPPWTQVVDAFVFSLPTSGATYGFPNLNQGTYHPDNLSRGSRAADWVANSVNAWYGGSLTGGTGDSTIYNTAKVFDNTGVIANPAATPGFHNLGGNPNDEVDNDLDGQVDLMEQAFGTNPGLRSSIRYPQPSLVEVSGQRYQAYTFPRRKSGTGTAADYSAGGYRYQIELSTNLATWTPGGAGVVQVSAVDDGNGTTETVTVRLATPATNDTKGFLRLKTTRP
ncbi:hypothetical protein [Haloferula sp. BvORR071]|uniref:hypothetical protein n=1 Tax=Haloferula sp. BvORR071 TaxID=1396141 RepID=UPI000558CAF3|nr:hypothetical protein [Haloferula sp. BvORR071]